MTRTLTASALATVLGSALLAATPASVAANSAAPQLAQSQQSQPTNFSDADLRSFAAAAIEVQDLSQQWQKRLEDSEGDQQESQKVREQATREIRQAVRDEGLTVEKYNRISLAARQDDDLRRKLNGYFEAQQ